MLFFWVPNSLYVLTKSQGIFTQTLWKICKYSNHWATMTPTSMYRHAKTLCATCFQMQIGNYTSFSACLPYRIRTETILMAWLDLWLWDVITLCLVIWCFIWTERAINSTALQSDNVIMALATQDKQIALLLVKAFTGFTFLDLESPFTPTLPNTHFPAD